MRSSSPRRRWSLKKSHVGLTFIRESDHLGQELHRTCAEARRPHRVLSLAARVQWSPTGNNVPDYPKLAQLWWQNIGDASSGAKTPQQAMDSLEGRQDVGRQQRFLVQPFVHRSVTGKCVGMPGCQP
jgi:glycerol transport system substrate-binding protein